LIETALLVARLLLALVFVVAGVAKLADPKGSRQAIVDFGVPAALATPLGILLPLAELAVAAALLPASTAWWSAVGALVLLLLFVVGIGNSLARGRKPDCHCFGQLHSAPVGWKTFARNAALAAVAGFIVWQGYQSAAGPSALGWLSTPSAVQIVAVIVGLIVLGLLGGTWWFLLQLFRQNGRLLSRVEALEGRLLASGVAPSANGSTEGLSVGTSAPAFDLSGVSDEQLTLDSLLASGKPVVLLFTDPDCGPCTEMLPEIARWQQEYAEELTLSLISRGAREENRAKNTEYGLRHVVLEEDWEVSDKYDVHGTPSAVLVQPDGTIGSSVAEGAESVRALMAYAKGYAAAQREAMPEGGPKLEEPASESRA
jgi:peroxiredoxin